MAKPLNRKAELLSQLAQRPAADPRQFHVLQVLPYAFVWIQIRGVARQPLQMNTTSGLAQKAPYLFRAMGRQTVPYDQQLSSYMPQQMTQEANHRFAVEGFRLHTRVELPLRRDGADRRETIPLGTGLELRCLSGNSGVSPAGA